MDTTLQDPFVGRLLDGRYRVESRIARGGMATVYLGVDDRLGREVALKIMHGHLAEDPVFVSRFNREARAAARLSHPNVVQVFDQGEDGSVLYLAMEYLPGRTLRDALNQRGALTPRQSLSVLEPVLDALSAAHRSGIVHRDIKPENVILTDDGRVKVADFGLARAASAATSSSGVLLGTVAYLAPELVARGIADARADVYAAGIVLFEMLTGRQPFTGEMPAQIAFRHVHEDVPAPSEMLPYLPPELDSLTRIATARDPDSRPPDAAAMLALTRGVRFHLGPELLDRAPDGMNPAPVVPGLAGPADSTRVVDDREGYPDDGGGYPDHADTLVGGDLIPSDDMIGRGLDHYRGPDPQPVSDAAETAETAEAGTRPRGPQSYWWSVLILAVFALGVALWWSKAGPGAFTVVPDVTNVEATQAERELVAAGFTVAEQSTYDDTIPAGHVIGTDPRTGEGVRKGGRITLMISRGPELVVVPGVAKQSPEQAEKTLGDAGLTVATTTTRYSGSVPKGQVIGTDPKADTEVKIDTGITLVVSKGPQPVEVPSVVGKSRGDAEKAITGAGLAVTVDEQYDDRVPAGQVISQKPTGGTLLPGKKVAIVVSLGPEMVEVPNVTDLRPDEARRQLERAGFEVEVRGTRILNRVWQQSPGGGETAPRGSTVVITTI